jgi:V/A-type H+-transporting ATPase subunit I
MRKLEVLELEEYVDASLRFLGQAGVVQFIDIREKPEIWKDVLVPYEVPTNTLTRCSDILAKIDTSSKEMGLEIQKGSESIQYTMKHTEEILDEVEKRLAELPLEALAKCLGIISRADLLLATLEVKPEEMAIKEVSLEKPLEDTLVEIERELSETEEIVTTTGLKDHKAFINKMKSLLQKEKTEFSEELLKFRKFVDATDKLLTIRKLADQIKKSLEARSKLEDIRNELSTLRNIVEREKQIAEAKSKFMKTDKTVYFEAWVPQTGVKETINKLKDITDNYCIVAEEPPARGDKVPTIIKPNSGYCRAFQKLTLAFGNPCADECNPVHIMTITFSLLFGIMFADVGHGALLAIAGLAFTFLRRKVRIEKVGDIIRYILEGGEMFIMLGISAIFFGFLFGEFFGPSGVIPPISLGKFGPFYLGGFEPAQEPMKMLRFALLVGVAHLSLGFILRLWNEIKTHHYNHVLIPTSSLWLLLGGFFMWAYFGGISNISKWFSDGIFLFSGLVVSPLIVLIVSVGLVSGFTEGIGIGVEVFVETLGHSISYSRLMALGLIHSAMSSLFLVLGGVEHGYFPLGSIPFVAGGTILVLVIEGLIVFVHTLRLHWVEWFSEFYTGEGILFKPFKI